MNNLINVRKYSTTLIRQQIKNTNQGVKLEETKSNWFTGFFIKVSNKIAQIFGAKTITQQNLSNSIQYANISLSNNDIDINDACEAKATISQIRNGFDNYLRSPVGQTDLTKLNILDEVINKSTHDKLIKHNMEKNSQDYLINFRGFPQYKTLGGFPFSINNAVNYGVAQCVYILSNDGSKSRLDMRCIHNPQNKEVLSTHLNDCITGNSFNDNQKQLFHLARSKLWLILKPLLYDVELMQKLGESNYSMSKITEGCRMSEQIRRYVLETVIKDTS